MTKAFITGLTGFAGKHLATHLLNRGFSVSGTYLSEESARKLQNKDKLDLYQLDLSDREKTFSVIESVKPEYVFHLAALSSPRESFKDPVNTFMTNISG
jgi:GDP-4-dehydro-6-deoxy-D-mannose reductase